MGVLPAFGQAISSGKTSIQPDFPHVGAYYYQGNSRMALRVALDEFYVHNEPGHGLDVAGLGSRDTVTNHNDRAALVRLENPGRSLAAHSHRAQAFSSIHQRVEGVAYSSGDVGRTKANRRIITRQIRVKTYPDISIESLQVKYGFEVIEEIAYEAGAYIVEMPSDELLVALDVANALYESGEVEYAQLLIRQHYSTRFVPNDPLYSTYQWHLNNVGFGAPFINGNDANITSAWDQVTGAGVNILIVDEGIALDHEDLETNALTDLDYDFVDNDDSPLPPPGSTHGSASAGIALATGNNSIGVTGAAFDASLVGIRLLGATETSFVAVASALSHKANEAVVSDQAHISNNSWGPEDWPSYKDQLDSGVEAALVNGIENGRNGKGVVYVWAGGNGRTRSDRSSYDPYTSSRYTVTVAASGGQGRYSNYSEPGPCILVNAPSSFNISGEGSGSTTTTSTVGYDYFFGGTSSAAPLVSGVVALMLEKNSTLTWRDVQQILVETSTETDITESEWIVNGAGHLYNENYGFGRVNALAAVNAAGSWVNLPAASTPVSSGESNISVNIPDNDAEGIDRGTTLSTPGSFSVEHVELTVNITHTSRGNLSVSLTSPAGTVSTFIKKHNDSVADYDNWTFGSVAHWGEDPNGTWTLTVSDEASSNVGILRDWSVRVYGTTPTVTIPSTSYVYVDQEFDGYEQGSSGQPFNALEEGMAHVNAAGTLDLAAGTYSRSPTLRFDQPMRLECTESGTVEIH